jgi:transcriptional regulator GlxA family with amidase domain
MVLANIPLAAKVAAGGIAGLALLGGGVAVGARMGDAQASSSLTPVVASPAPTPAKAGGSAANQAARRVAVQAEAQVLGTTVKQLNADVKSGKTVQQLAAAKGLTQDQFRTQFQAAVKAELDKAVASGTLTADQEQKTVARLAAAIPNWNGAKPAPSPSASP